MLFKKVKTIYLCKDAKQVASGVVSLARGEDFKLAPSCLLGSWLHFQPNLIDRASVRSPGKEVKFHRIFRDRFAEKSVDFRGLSWKMFEANFAEKQSVEKG